MCSLWNHLLLYSCLILPLIHVNVFGITLTCDETYRAENGRQCYPCSAGYHKVSDCMIDGEQSRCMPCGQGHYMSSCDIATKCEPCRSFCPGRQVKVKNCTATNDMICQCKPGFFWIDYEVGPYHGHCKAHQECKVGEGLVAEGTPATDTKCMPCENGITFSNSSSFEPCKPCSTCNTSVESDCTAYQDTVCLQLTHKLQKEDSNSSKSLEPGTIAWIVVGVVIVVLLIAIIILFRYMRGIGDKKPDSAEEGLGNDVSPTHVETTYPISNREEARPTASEFENSSDKNSGSFSVVNQVFLPDFRNSVEIKDKPGQKNETVCSSSSSQLHPCSSLSKQEECSFENKCTTKPDGKRSLKNENMSSSRSKENTEKYHNEKAEISETKRDSISDHCCLSNDTDLTIDASAVSARLVSSDEIDEPGNHYQQDDTKLEDMDTDKGAVAVEHFETKTEDMPLGSEYEDKLWFEIFVFLQCRMSFQSFKIFVRRLAYNTNKEFYKIVDVRIENSKEESNCSKERIYQIMTEWKQANPKAHLKDVLEALNTCHLNSLCEDLVKDLIDKGFLDEKDHLLNTETAHNGDEADVFVRNEPHVQETYNFTESTSEDGRFSLNMEKLKSFRNEHDNVEFQDLGTI